MTLALPLPLSFKGDAARSARLLRVTVSNYGTAVIGKPDTLWTLQFQSPAGSHLVLLRDPEIRPRTTVFYAATAASNSLTFDAGAFQRRAEVNLSLLVVNAPPGVKIPLKTDISLAREKSLFGHLRNASIDVWLCQS